MGGIAKAEDVIEFMLAGATAVQIGTASYWDPRATERIVDELQQWCVEHRIQKLTDITGALEVE
jgi:dihydroorotate dehydrogenase (NAD+) catalytic subunit